MCPHIPTVNTTRDLKRRSLSKMPSPIFTKVNAFLHRSIFNRRRTFLHRWLINSLKRFQNMHLQPCELLFKQKFMSCLNKYKKVFPVSVKSLEYNVNSTFWTDLSPVQIFDCHDIYALWCYAVLIEFWWKSKKYKSADWGAGCARLWPLCDS